MPLPAPASAARPSIAPSRPFRYPLLPGTSAASKTKLVYGYSAGVGMDVMLVGGLFMRAEYEYRRVTSDIETNINTVRAGLGYKF